MDLLFKFYVCCELKIFSRYIMLSTSICNLDDFNDKVMTLEIILQLTFTGQLVNKESTSDLHRIMQTLIN